MEELHDFPLFWRVKINLKAVWIKVQQSKESWITLEADTAFIQNCDTKLWGVFCNEIETGIFLSWMKTTCFLIPIVVCGGQTKYPETEFLQIQGA